MIITGSVMKMIRFKYKGFSGWGFLRDGLIHVLSGDIYRETAEIIITGAGQRIGKPNLMQDR
jgi:hypothetical protein